MSELHSVTELLQRFQDGEQRAAHEIWERFIDRLVRAADKKLKHLPRRSVDEEDVAQSAFHSFFRGAREDRFCKLENRDDLWQILAMLTERKAIAVLRRELAGKRGGGRIRGESVFENLLTESAANKAIGNVADPDPELVECFTRDVRDQLETLDDGLRRIAIKRLEGYTNSEIASHLGISVRAVDRKIRLIKDKWKSEIDRCG